jgi:hypothetical protein
MSVCCECCVLSGRSLCDGLITCPEESYRLWRVVVGDLETSRMRKRWPTEGLSHQKQNKNRLMQSVPLLTKPGSSLIILTPMMILQRYVNRSTFVV